MTTLPPESNGEQPVQPQQPAQPVQPQQPAAPQYQQAPPAGAYQQPPAGGYQQPGAAPAADPVSNLTLNYWLSVFFTWLPALIFWLIEKDKGNQRATQLHVANFNFSLLRTGVYILLAVPYLNILAGLAGLVLFVFHIMAAVKVAEAYRNGTPADPFIFNVPIVK